MADENGDMSEKKAWQIKAGPYTIERYVERLREHNAVFPFPKWTPKWIQLQLADRLEQAQELAELKQGIIEAADVRIRELEAQLEQAERERDAELIEFGAWVSANRDQNRVDDAYRGDAESNLACFREFKAENAAASLPTPKQEK